MVQRFEPSPLAPRRTADETARDYDLGFGSIVSRDSRQRLLHRDGSFNVIRSGLGRLEGFAPYHQLLTVSWTAFLGVAAAFYLLLNVLFAFAYMASGEEALVGTGGSMVGGAFGRAFFFSVQTFATIGYARSSYRAGEIMFNARFRSMFVQVDGQSRVTVDVSRIHDIEDA